MGSADDANNRDAAVDECDDDLCEVDIPFSIIDGGSSDEDDFDQRQHNYHDAEKIDDKAIMNCFNFSVTAHITGSFVSKDNTNEGKSKIEKAGKEAGKCNIEKDAVQKSTQPTGSWFPAQLPLPKWAASD